LVLTFDRDFLSLQSPDLSEYSFFHHVRAPIHGSSFDPKLASYQRESENVGEDHLKTVREKKNSLC